jgi:hypothetical protein
MSLPLNQARREFERLQALDKPLLTCLDVARIMECDQYDLHMQAEVNAAALGFPVIIMGRRVKIPKAAFLDYIARNVLGDGCNSAAGWAV